MNIAISAYIPCFNNEETVVQAIRSIYQQSVPISEIFLIDDCSSDRSATLAQAEGISIIRNPQNEGRGAVRARAMNHAKNELVLSCDAGIVLSPDFVERALPWLENDNVAAVHGRVLQPPATNAIERWRGRHLFKVDNHLKPSHQSLLLTGGAIVRKSVVLGVGNFDNKLLFSEDADLGERLLAADYQVILDPAMKMTAITKNDLWQVLERYSRWHSNRKQKLNFFDYARLVSYSIKVMVREDLQTNDWQSALISIACPHYQFWSLYNSEVP